MMRAQEFFALLFDDYVTIAPQAMRIFEQIESRFGKIQNDHVAFRTFASSRLGLEAMETPLLGWGYTREQSYDFPDKHLRAFGYVPSDPELPLVFFSEILVEQLPLSARNWIERALSQLPSVIDPKAVLRGSRPWSMPTWAEYQMLNEASPYAAWLAVWGLRANHFTVAVHELPRKPNLEQLVGFLRSEGATMSEEGGLIKGDPSVLLEQASTVAEERRVTFRDGSVHGVPSCYYEFALRYVDSQGDLYRGFVPQSANHIFESTTARAV